jgi:hypothetical protein
VRFERFCGRQVAPPLTHFIDWLGSNDRRTR